MENFHKATGWCAHFIREQVKEGDLCIDATMGNGHDTLLLSRLAGESGQVFALDIQPEALDNTRRLLLEEEAPFNYRLILDSHVHLCKYAEPDSVSCMVFNFGYLPGGDHAKATGAFTSREAVLQGLCLLKKGGLMSLCIYSGGDTGFEERDLLLETLRVLPPEQYLVIQSEYANRPNHPPIPALIYKR